MIWWICGALVVAALSGLVCVLGALLGSLGRFGSAARTVRVRLEDQAGLAAALAVTAQRAGSLAATHPGEPGRS